MSMKQDTESAIIRNAPEAESAQEMPDEGSSNNGKEKEKSTYQTLPYYKLFSFANSSDILLMVMGALAAVANGITLPLLTILVGNLASGFGESSNTKEMLNEISKVAVKLVLLGMGAGLAGFIQVTCWTLTGERKAARIRGLYLKTILRQDIEFFDMETRTGEIIERMSGDTILIQDAMGEKVGNLIQQVATFIGSFVVAFTKGWLLTLVMLSCVPALVITGSVVSNYITKVVSQGQTANSLAANVALQTIGAIRTVASFTGEKQAIAKYNEFLTMIYKSSVLEGLAAGLGYGAFDFVIYSSYGLTVWYGGKMILEKGYSGGNVVTIYFCVVNALMSLGQTSPCVTAFAAGQAAAYKMFKTIERKPLIDASDSNGVKLLDDIRGDIELKDVYFSYPSRPNEQIFNGFTLSIPCGMTAALVGHSGSGKSTIISLIERFYDPQAGEVLIDGINLKEFQLKWIRQKIGLVSQEPVLFTCSIKDNIAYGKDRASVEDIRAAAELANAAKFIDNLPQGLDTMVGQHGTQLSGGQKQRIAIARAILKDPKILLLDEATSALDAESERIVQEALDKIMINRTTVIVAHRLSTVRNSNMIAVIHRGKIVEKGTHAELTKEPEGAYSQLIRMTEKRKVSEHVVTRQEKSEIIVDNTGSHSNVMSPIQRYMTWGSPGIGNWSSPGIRSGSPSTFSVPFSPQTGIRILGTPPAEPYTSASEHSKPPPEVPLRRLAFLNKPEIPMLLLGSIAASVIGATLPVWGILNSNIMNSFFEPEHKLRKDTRFWALTCVLVAVVSVLANPLKSYFFAVAGSKLINRIRSMSFEKVIYMEVSWFDQPEHSSGAIGARLSADAALVRSLVGDALGLLVQNVVALLTGLVIALEASWQLALVLLVFLPILGLEGYFFKKFIKAFAADCKKMYEEASQVAYDAIGSIRTVASFCAEEKMMELYQKKCEGPMKAGVKQGLIGGASYGISSFILFCVYASSFYAGARFVDAGEATFTDVFRVFYALILIGIVISRSGSFSPDSNKARSAVSSVFAILDRKSKIDSNDESGMTIENFKGDIELRHVSFKYPTRPDVQIFRDISLAIRSGKTVALVGESGSGKSTVISLLQRFYDPDKGVITLDGIEIQKLRLKWLRQQMGLVSQEPLLFDDTIRANIAYGKDGSVTEAEILAAAELANAHVFISSLKQGYDTMVGERGVQLSGGQKQRVAIARAILKAPKILLLDEATSALDAESERVVQDALDRVMVGRTTVVVAHRLSTIKGADLIAVVKNGVIAEKGKHETLVNIKDGIYASLVALQTNK